MHIFVLYQKNKGICNQEDIQGPWNSALTWPTCTNPAHKQENLEQSSWSFTKNTLVHCSDDLSVTIFVQVHQLNIHKCASTNRWDGWLNTASVKGSTSVKPPTIFCWSYITSKCRTVAFWSMVSKILFEQQIFIFGGHIKKRCFTLRTSLVGFSWPLTHLVKNIRLS